MVNDKLEKLIVKTLVLLVALYAFMHISHFDWLK